MYCLGWWFQTDTCLSNRYLFGTKQRKKSWRAPVSLSFSFPNVKDTVFSDSSICLEPTPRISKHTIGEFNLSCPFCNTSQLFSVVRMILNLTIQILLFTRRGTGTTPHAIFLPRQGIYVCGVVWSLSINQQLINHQLFINSSSIINQWLKIIHQQSTKGSRKGHQR